MGQVVIDIPENIFVSFRVDDSKVSKRLLEDLKPYSKDRVSKDVIPPRRNKLREDGDAVFGIWADREDSAQEIARKIREKNRRVT